MEQQVASQLEALGLHVLTNWAFEDVDEGKSREIDVRAIKRMAYNEEKKIAAYLEVIAECKNYSNPLVFIGRSKSDIDDLYAPEEMVFPVEKYKEIRETTDRKFQYRDKDAFFHLGFEQVHHGFTSNMKAVQFCRINRRGKNWQADHGGLYDSIFYPMAKALLARKRKIPKSARPNEWSYFWLFVPIVVTSGDIFFIDSTVGEPVPEERDYISFKREIQSENVKGTFAIDFIRQNQIDLFFSECLQPLVQKMDDLTMNDTDFVMTREIPWEN